jgi:hypothetical protein
MILPSAPELVGGGECSGRPRQNGRAPEKCGTISSLKLTLECRNFRIPPSALIGLAKGFNAARTYKISEVASSKV